MLKFFVTVSLILSFSTASFASSFEEKSMHRHDRLQHIGSLSRFIVDAMKELNLTPEQEKKISTYINEFKEFRRQKFEEYRNQTDANEFFKERKNRRKIFYKAKQKLRQNIRATLNQEQVKQLEKKVKQFIKDRKRHHDNSRCNDRR